MPFQPPRCPFDDCSASVPGARFPWRRRGTFVRACDGRVVQRFLCLTCLRSFSTQSFRFDYRLRNPFLHKPVFGHLVSKVTHRQAARLLGVTRKTVELRLRRLGEHCRLFHAARLAGKHIGGVFQLDEAETFETDRRLKPVTMPVLIERKTRFIVHTESAPLPARGNLSPALEARKREYEALEGQRKSGSRAAVKKCFEALAAHLDPAAPLVVQTDRKATYPGILRDVFTARAVVHETTSSRTKRDGKNLICAINHTLAMLRDGLSRMVRRTWAHAKWRVRLAQHMWVYVVYRNYVRYRSNKEKRATPAMRLGIEVERWTLRDLLRWSARFPELLRVQ
ncbi:MAG TPA: hypothetical protein PLX85_09380 [Dehalococcoidia bacterium]|jgi:transposase-like protein|nr:hypothetical protein [Dehalococcoidia bacterium]